MSFVKYVKDILDTLPTNSAGEKLDTLLRLMYSLSAKFLQLQLVNQHALAMCNLKRYVSETTCSTTRPCIEVNILQIRTQQFCYSRSTFPKNHSMLCGDLMFSNTYAESHDQQRCLRPRSVSTSPYSRPYISLAVKTLDRMLAPTSDSHTRVLAVSAQSWKCGL